MPEIDIFGFLDGASAWWWVALALVLGAVEVMTFTYFLLWLTLGAATVALMLFVAPATAGTTQAVVFALSALAYAVAGWALVRSGRMATSSDEPGLNRRAVQMIGRTAIVTGSFRAGVGSVEVDGVHWRARLERGPDGVTPEPGSALSVRGVEGAILLVAPEG